MSIYVAQESRHCCGMRKSEINATSQNSGNLQRDFHKFSRIPQLGSINDDVSNGKKVFKEIWHFTKFDVLSQKSSSIFKSQMSSFSWKWKFKPWSFNCQKFRPVDWPKEVVGAKLKFYIKFQIIDMGLDICFDWFESALGSLELRKKILRLPAESATGH